uniref:SFRICE_014972 n=1 Tax=Spodoptera frugiperda TaxID=7108 RepID=A0A2H1VVS4_SPOFR
MRHQGTWGPTLIQLKTKFRPKLRKFRTTIPFISNFLILLVNQ